MTLSIQCEKCSTFLEPLSEPDTNWGWCYNCQHGTCQRTYSDVKPTYHTDTYVRHNGDFSKLKEEWNTNISLLQKHTEERKVLDIGFLEGSGMAAMRDAGFRCIGFDVSENAKTTAIRNGIASSQLIVSPDGFKASMLGRPMPIITCREVIEHVPDTGSLLTEIHAALSTGGIVQLQTPRFHQSIRFWACPEHLRVYSTGSLILECEKHSLMFVDSCVWPGGMCLTFRKEN